MYTVNGKRDLGPSGAPTQSGCGRRRSGRGALAKVASAALALSTEPCTARALASASASHFAADDERLASSLDGSWTGVLPRNMDAYRPLFQCCGSAVGRQGARPRLARHVPTPRGQRHIQTVLRVPVLGWPSNGKAPARLTACADDHLAPAGGGAPALRCSSPRTRTASTMSCSARGAGDTRGRALLRWRISRCCC